MANFARIDKNNIVQAVIVVDNKDLLNEHGIKEEDFGINFLNNLFGVGFTWVQTSYNTYGGVHYGADDRQPDGGTPLRKNYAGIDFTYDSVRDAFITPKPYDSWVLNEDTCCYEAPEDFPDDGKKYIWDEAGVEWELDTSMDYEDEQGEKALADPDYIAPPNWEVNRRV